MQCYRAVYQISKLKLAWIKAHSHVLISLLLHLTMSMKVGICNIFVCTQACTCGPRIQLLYSACSHCVEVRSWDWKQHPCIVWYFCGSLVVEWKVDSGWFRGPSLGHWCHTHFVCCSFLVVVNVFQTWFIWHRLPFITFISAYSAANTEPNKSSFRRMLMECFWQHFNEWILLHQLEWKGDWL